MGGGKSKLEGVTVTVTFESQSRAFNAENPIIGVVTIDTN